MTPEEQERLDTYHDTARHVGATAEEMVFRMLSKGATTCGAISTSMDIGILVGPAWLITLARAHMISVTPGLETVPGTERFLSDPPVDRNKPCQN